MLKDLCLYGTSGDESAVRDYIISKIKEIVNIRLTHKAQLLHLKRAKK